MKFVPIYAHFHQKHRNGTGLIGRNGRQNFDDGISSPEMEETNFMAGFIKN